MNTLTQNYIKYLERYDSELLELYGDEYQKRLEKVKNSLYGLPITHTTNIAYIPLILQQGLVPFAYRRELNYKKSAIFDYDKVYGLDKCVFAVIGYCSSYGPNTGRVTILLDDSIILDVEDSFFTFHDLTAILLFNEGSHNNPFVNRIIHQYQQEKLPLKNIYDILSRTFLKSNFTLETFMENNFPVAYDPDFQHTNSGNPEIKIPSVIPPEKFIGFVVWDEQTKQSLINCGIEESQVILLTKESNAKKEIYRYKNGLMNFKKR